MSLPARVINPLRGYTRLFSWGDGVILAGLVAAIYLGVRLAFNAPPAIRGPEISLQPAALPYYTALSVARMLAAYVLSLVFTLLYGRLAAYNPRARQILIPLLDVLQSVPILSFLPVVLLSLSAFLPEGTAAEVASIVLIFTSQAWNLTFAWYQSLTTIPKELREASAIFRLNSWFRFLHLELPFAAISLVWNSMMSWAGGWFFLMAAEIFTLGQRDFRLLGLGAYLREAASQENYTAIGYGMLALVATILLLDHFIWRPLLAWSERFKVEMVESDNPPTSWVYSALRGSRIAHWFGEGVIGTVMEKIDAWSLRGAERSQPGSAVGSMERRGPGWLNYLINLVLGAAILYGLVQAAGLLGRVPLADWGRIALGLGATLLRVTLALILALAWTVPLGVAVGTNPRLYAFFQPLVQVTAAIPATALFPILLVFFLRLPAGIDIAAVILMLLGTQWYLLFNIIAGASSIPQDLKYTSRLLHLVGWERWRSMILPALFPYIVTGAITASGGAWNASIVSEYVHFGGQTLKTVGIGALIAETTAAGNYPLLLAATLSLILAVVLINRLVWRRLYRLAEERYRME